MSSVREMIAQSLRQQGYDGLYNEDGECGCGIDNLMLCENSIAGLGDCRPAFERTCPCCCETIYIADHGTAKRMR